MNAASSMLRCSRPDAIRLNGYWRRSGDERRLGMASGFNLPAMRRIGVIPALLGRFSIAVEAFDAGTAAFLIGAGVEDLCEGIASEAS